MRNDLTKETILALSTSFQQAVAIGIYEKKQLVRVYEPSKILEAFHQVVRWQISLQNSSNPEHEEARQKERQLARRIFVGHSIPCLSCIFYMALQKWLVLCYAVTSERNRDAIPLKLTQVEWGHIFSTLLAMRADGMSSEDSERSVTGGLLLKKRKAVWRSKELQDFLKKMQPQIKSVIDLPYVELPEPLPSRRPAPPGLTSNFYDPEYLKNLSPVAREQLNLK